MKIYVNAYDLFEHFNERVLEIYYRKWFVFDILYNDNLADNPDDIWIRLAGDGEVLKNRVEFLKERGIRIKEVG